MQSLCELSGFARVDRLWPLGRIIPDCNEREAKMLTTDQLALRPLGDDDAPALLALLLANRAFLEP
ncbi:MAG: hypothetical protein H7Y32_14095, partial [Chloroflexales bacterium]|nr:hypothetical protein [Chloroflexales bacterium]